MRPAETNQIPAHTGTPSQQGHHGSTPAAWVTFAIITCAFFIGTLALVLGNWPMFWVGVALIPIGAVAGKLLQRAGFGTIPRRR